MAGAIDALFELDVRVHPEPARPGRREADEVRLHRPGREHGVGAARPRLAEVELELAHLVPAEGQPRAVVALDPQLDPEGGAEARRRVERRRRVPEPHPRKPVDGGKRAGHDGRRARLERAVIGVSFSHRPPSRRRGRGLPPSALPGRRR